MLDACENLRTDSPLPTYQAWPESDQARRTCWSLAEHRSLMGAGSQSPNDPHVITTLSAILGIDERTLFEKAGQPQPDIETSPTIEQEMASLTRTDRRAARPGRSAAPEPASVLLAEPTRSPSREYGGANLRCPSRDPCGHDDVAAGPRASYMEDRSQRQLYRVRNLATIVMLVALGIAFVWAAPRG